MDFLSLSVPNLENLILFLLPGFLFLVLFFYQIPDKRKSDFTTIFFSVIVSLIINNVVSLDFQLFNYSSYVSRRTWNLPIEGPGVYWAGAFFSLCFSALVARFITSRFFRWFAKVFLDVTASPFGRLWNHFFEVKKVSVFRVTMNNGFSYVGKLEASSVDPDDNVQELTLVDPYIFEIKGGRAKVKPIKETEIILLEGSSIISAEKINSEFAEKLYDLNDRTGIN